MNLLNLEKYPLAARLLIAFLHQDPPASLVNLLETATDETWEQTYNLAVFHSVAPLVYVNSQRFFPHPPIPEQVEKKFKETYLVAIKENFLLFTNSQKILSAFHTKGIPVIPLKGLFLSQKIYPNIATRIMGDIDLLVHQDDLPVALDVLEEIGYQINTVLNIDQEVSFNHSLPPLIGSGFHEIDLHWTLAPPSLPFHIDLEQVWGNARTDTVAEVEILALTPEHLLLHLALHFTYLHRYLSRLFHIYDIAQVLQTYQAEIDWNTLADLAKAWGLCKTTFLAIEIARQLLGAPVDEEKLHQLTPDDYDPRMVDWLVDHLLLSTDFSISLSEFWAPNPWTSRFQIFINRIFFPPWLIRKKYPRLAAGPGIIFAYPLRLLDVVRRHIRSAWLLMRQDASVHSAFEELNHVNQLGQWLEKP